MKRSKSKGTGLKTKSKTRTSDPSPAIATAEISLSPSQAATFAQALRGLQRSPTVMIWGPSGRGKSTVLTALHRQIGGGLVRARDIVETVASGHPLALEEGFFQAVLREMKTHSTVFVDDFDATTGVFHNCSFYPRSGWFEAAALALTIYATENNRRLVIAGKGNLPGSVRARAEFAKLDRLNRDDYMHLCRLWLGDVAAKQLHFDKVFRFAPNLTAYQLRGACTWLATLKGLTTEAFLDYLRSQRLASNVSLDEVAEVDLNSLRGIDDVITSLETNVVLPLEHDDLVTKFALRPKRGVLLAGPPGTGKTTIGRALARRLRGKFLLIDGTVISGTRNFYQRIDEIFSTAQENAPAIIFIDDGDVLFEDKEEFGLYRYLLTKLDGLESEKAGHVCVMMTAMDVGSLPAALVRSGRIELWLQTRLPDDAARRQILDDLMKKQPDVFGNFELERIVSETSDFTGADIKRMLEDAKLSLASDVARQTAQQSFTDYLLIAAHAVRENKHRYAEAVAQSRSHHRDPKALPGLHFSAQLQSHQAD